MNDQAPRPEASPGDQDFGQWIARATHDRRQSDIDFHDDRLEYRRLFSEVWGTFLLAAWWARWRSARASPSPPRRWRRA